jgi:hypothetical protein
LNEFNPEKFQQITSLKSVNDEKIIKYPAEVISRVIDLINYFLSYSHYNTDQSIPFKTGNYQESFQRENGNDR